MAETATKPKAKPAKIGAEKPTPEEQRRRFEELAREAGSDESSGDGIKAAVIALEVQKPARQPLKD